MVRYLKVLPQRQEIPKSAANYSRLAKCPSPDYIFGVAIHQLVSEAIFHQLRHLGIKYSVESRIFND
eukprot:1354533-Amorphochlora_amoeboformis.AAC.1